MHIYISGKITGDENYKFKFNIAVSELYKKYELLNPIITSMPSKEHLKLEDATWEECMSECLLYLDECDTIYMLRDWKESKGACIELGYAIAKDMQVIFQE